MSFLPDLMQEYWYPSVVVVDPNLEQLLPALTAAMEAVFVNKLKARPVITTKEIRFNLISSKHLSNLNNNSPFSSVTHPKAS